MRITTLAVTALVLVMGAPAYATDLYSVGLYSGGNGNTLECTATNTGAANITMTIQIFDFGSTDPDVVNTVVKECGPNVIVFPGDNFVCWHQFTFHNVAYCKVKTSNAAKTQAVFMVLDPAPSYQSAAAAVLR